jgi:hypothetical protein
MSDYATRAAERIVGELDIVLVPSEMRDVADIIRSERDAQPDGVQQLVDSLRDGYQEKAAEVERLKEAWRDAEVERLENESILKQAITALAGLVEKAYQEGRGDCGTQYGGHWHDSYAKKKLDKLMKESGNG